MHAQGFFGPTGVEQTERGNGIGKALLMESLWGLRELGYVYGIIGGAGPVEFYQRKPLERSLSPIAIRESTPIC